MKKCQYAVSGKLQKEGKKLSPAQKDGIIEWRKMSVFQRMSGGHLYVLLLISSGSLRTKDSGEWARCLLPHVRDKKVRLEGRCKSTPEALGITDMILLSVSVYINSSIFQKHSMTSLRVARTTIGFLSILLVVSYVQQQMKHRKITKLREKFFEQNGGGMLVQRLSRPGTSNANVKIFTEEGMKTSTNGYDESRILGQGGQGTVYKGILPDNSIVAIKKARLGDNSQVEQFINEVLVLSQINHRNVVKLLGCCLETEVPLLVYEFINSGTLFDHLHGSLFGPSLTWDQRLRIAVEIAGTLAYLHSSASIPIIHRDVKTANILLDENLTAKVADFGASRLIPMDKEQLTTMVQGTIGYLDPEYYHTGLLNEKSDVYSFGVVVMELLTGQKVLCFERPQQSKHLVNYIASALKENRLHEVIDEKVINENNWKEIEEAVRVAMECTRVTGEERPLMKEVAAKLEGLRVTKAKHQWSDQYPGDEAGNLVADFGASRLIPMDKEQLTTMVQGTIGYLDPEYYHTGLLNEKSDVYSFGVVVMELLTGQKALCFERPQQSKHLVNYISSAMKENRLHEVIDAKIINENSWKEINEAVRVAMECTRVTGEERPLMTEVAAKLEGLRVTKAKHQWSDQYPGDETENLVGVGVLSAQGDTSSTGYDSIKNVASMQVAAGR
ncbi:hypothetical protein F2Q69_00061175 [Brassica cretica]|uniref:Protein kinase domain-containing protein n=1 Tax=Brassica cretica TaxID=69181 RepID=A0A8S9REV8_BRACR|nr:hypothetical protein F2Q69_00061175 [Brassica cretica]